MISAIREWLAERAGRSQAAREIQFLSAGYFTKAQAAEQQNERLKENGGRNPYARGHGERWNEEGHRDAQAGRTRSAKFGNTDYDIGWIEGMRARHGQGFRHEKLEPEYESLVRLLISPDLWPSFGVRHEEN
ncbi:hypothetical protein [Sinorhizobium meliloti]|uniref:hypothetical protein n=1 Tax=Rhizobium meliloti TaxID=382 RepID=UPI000FDC549C|nr:hypothetical protein [Sinorhizobium meliloti]RVI80156.1 hypothetical protein CN191_12280 [Sinorhizobium meliloti]